MSPETEQALLSSIAHWERMRDDRDGCLESKETPHAGSCALCSQFCNHPAAKCDGCPVRERTGFSFCIGSPWQNASIAFFGDPDFDVGKWQAAAQKEIDFLKSLLPKEAK